MTTGGQLPTRWKYALIALVALGLARAVSYFPPLVNPDRPAAHYLEALLQPQVWGVVWATVCVLVAVSLRHTRIVPLAVGLMVGLHAAWGLSFVAETVFSDSPRAWVSSLGYFGTAILAALIFSERPALSIRLRG